MCVLVPLTECLISQFYAGPLCVAVSGDGCLFYCWCEVYSVDDDDDDDGVIGPGSGRAWNGRKMSDETADCQI